MTKCIIDGCPNNGVHSIGVRCRRPDTTAIWAPNTDALLCDEHAVQGCVVEINITPTNDGKVHTKVSSGGRSKSRTTTITHDVHE